MRKTQVFSESYCFPLPYNQVFFPQCNQKSLFLTTYKHFVTCDLIFVCEKRDLKTFIIKDFNRWDFSHTEETATVQMRDAPIGWNVNIMHSHLSIFLKMLNRDLKPGK